MRVETLLERAMNVGSLRVDRGAGIIYSVKIIGPSSRNNRRYLPAALAKAKPLYEGRAVHVDHPSLRSANEVRPIASRIGWLQSVRESNGGLAGDLHILKSHELAPMIFEAAERRPQLFGLSHNAEGRTKREGNTTVVEEVTDVRSVDLVTDPATTSGLFESGGHRGVASSRPNVPTDPQVFACSIGADAVSDERAEQFVRDLDGGGASRGGGVPADPEVFRRSITE